MDSSAKSQVIILYHPSQITPEQITQGLCADLHQKVAPYTVVLKEKDHGVLAFIELPSETAQKLIQLKKVKILDVVCSVKRFYCDHQIFINKLASTIDVADVKDYFGQFGQISNVEIVVVKHTFDNGKSLDFRHCYIMFKDRESAEKVIMNRKRHFIKKQEIKTCRTYGIGEGDDTDKKIFMKIDPKCDQPEELQGIIQQKFIEFGKLREKLKIDEGKQSSTATIIMTSVESGEKAFNNLRDIQVGKYHVTLRPHSSELALFAPGLKLNLSEEEIKTSFSKFGRISACTLSQNRNNVQSATINFSNEDDAKVALVEYENTPEIASLYVDKPYLTIHMSIKERKEFSNFNKKNRPQAKTQFGNQLPQFPNMQQRFPHSNIPPQGQFQPQGNFQPQGQFPPFGQFPPQRFGGNPQKMANREI